jgi:hypothetical protein
MTYQDAWKYAEMIDKRLTAHDFDPSYWVYISENDGAESIMLINSAFFINKEEWFIVFREHGKPMVFHEEETNVCQLEEKECLVNSTGLKGLEKRPEQKSTKWN